MTHAYCPRCGRPCPAAGCGCGRPAAPPPLPSRRPPPPAAAPLPIGGMTSQAAWVVAGFVGGGAMLLVALVIVFVGRGPRPSGSTPTAGGPPAPARAEPTNRAEPAAARAEPADGTGVFRRLVPITVLIINYDNQGMGGNGTGAVVDRDQGLIVTNYHVVPARNTVVLSPEYDANGDVITDVRHYVRRRDQIVLPAEVVRRVPEKDLAVVRVDRLPSTARTVRLAGAPASPGEAVYSLGNSGIGDDPNSPGYLWRLTTGTVRGRGHARMLMDKDQVFDGVSLETQAPTNKGDSGGPVVNSRSELVAVVSSYHTKSREVSNNVDLTEVRAVLAEFGVR